MVSINHKFSVICCKSVTENTSRAKKIIYFTNPLRGNRQHNPRLFVSLPGSSQSRHFVKWSAKSCKSDSWRQILGTALLQLWIFIFAKTGGSFVTAESPFFNCSAQADDYHLGGLRWIEVKQTAWGVGGGRNKIYGLSELFNSIKRAEKNYKQTLSTLQW